jgi:hypothetical protein
VRDIRRLQIPMNDALLMRGLEGLRDLLGDAERLIDGNRPARDALIQTLAVEFEHEELRVVGLLEAVDLPDLWMIERREDLGFTTEASHAFGIVGE